MRARLAWAACAAWLAAARGGASPTVLCDFEATSGDFVLRAPDSEGGALMAPGLGPAGRESAPRHVPGKAAQAAAARRKQDPDTKLKKKAAEVPAQKPRLASREPARYERASVNVPEAAPKDTLVWASADGAVQFVRVRSRSKSFRYQWFEYQRGKLFAHFVEAEIMDEPELRVALWDSNRSMWIVLATGEARWVTREDPVEIHRSLPNFLFSGTFVADADAESSS